MGIDLIIETHDSTYIAIQCKYKKHVGTRQNILSWKALSTFYALCLRSGPWDKYIVMTNCVYTRHQGKKTTQDVSYCLKTLQNITKDEWLRMCDVHGAKLGSEEEEKNNIVEVPITTPITEDPITEVSIVKTNTKVKARTRAKVTKKAIVIPSPEELRNLRNSYYT